MSKFHEISTSSQNFLINAVSVFCILDLPWNFQDTVGNVFKTEQKLKNKLEIQHQIHSSLPTSFSLHHRTPELAHTLFTFKNVRLELEPNELNESLSTDVIWFWIRS